MAPETDEALARRGGRGDASAFEELIVRHQDRLYTLALRVTGSEADARDSLQDGLLAAWRALPGFRGEARFSTWMYRIVLRKAYDAVEARTRAPQPVDELSAAAPAADELERTHLLGALAALPTNARAVVCACDILGLSMEEAGALLELPPGTVKSRLHRARARLAASLEADPSR